MRSSGLQVFILKRLVFLSEASLLHPTFPSPQRVVEGLRSIRMVTTGLSPSSITLLASLSLCSLSLWFWQWHVFSGLRLMVCGGYFQQDVADSPWLCKGHQICACCASGRHTRCGCCVGRCKDHVPMYISNLKLAIMMKTHITKQCD